MKKESIEDVFFANLKYIQIIKNINLEEYFEAVGEPRLRSLGDKIDFAYLKYLSELLYLPDFSYLFGYFTDEDLKEDGDLSEIDIYQIFYENVAYFAKISEVAVEELLSPEIHEEVNFDLTMVQIVADRLNIDDYSILFDGWED